MTNTKSNEKPDSYKHELTDQLATTIQNYEDAREEYWKSKKNGMDWDTQKGIIAHADNLANLLLQGSKKLILQEPIFDAEAFQEELISYNKEISDEISGFAEITKQKFPMLKFPDAIFKSLNNLILDEKIPEEDSLLKLVWERIFVDLAWDTVKDRLIQGTNRLLQLAEVIVKVKAEPPESTLRFLCRVRRCFIWGFDSECIILCRGAIDTVFAEIISDQVCDKHKLKKANYGHTLTNRIKAAHLEGIIDDQIKNAAFKINTPATEAAHKNPEFTIDAFKMIKDTLFVIEYLAKYQKTK